MKSDQSPILEFVEDPKSEYVSDDDPVFVFSPNQAADNDDSDFQAISHHKGFPVYNDVDDKVILHFPS